MRLASDEKVSATSALDDNEIALESDESVDSADGAVATQSGGAVPPKTYASDKDKGGIEVESNDGNDDSLPGVTKKPRV